MSKAFALASALFIFFMIGFSGTALAHDGAHKGESHGTPHQMEEGSGSKEMGTGHKMGHEYSDKKHKQFEEGSGSSAMGDAHSGSKEYKKGHSVYKEGHEYKEKHGESSHKREGSGH